MLSERMGMGGEEGMKEMGIPRDARKVTRYYGMGTSSRIHHGDAQYDSIF